MWLRAAFIGVGVGGPDFFLHGPAKVCKKPKSRKATRLKRMRDFFEKMHDFTSRDIIEI